MQDANVVLPTLNFLREEDPRKPTKGKNQPKDRGLRLKRKRTRQKERLGKVSLAMQMLMSKDAVHMQYWSGDEALAG